MPTEPQPVTLAQVVHRAVEVCDDATGESLDDLLRRFEDADEPIAAVEDIEERLDETLGPSDVDDDDPAFTMARAVIVYLAYRRDEIEEDPSELLRLAARAEFHGKLPPRIAQWLSRQGIEV
jgi:hypothetical protein